MPAYHHALPFRLLVIALALAAAAGPGPARAAETTYVVDPEHTYPSFEADHLGGLSVWRGKFNRTTGQITLDKAAGTGSVDVQIDMSSVDFGNDKMNEIARGDMLFETGKHPQARYRGQLAAFKDGKPNAVEGTLSLHGVDQPLRLVIASFKCMPHPQHKRELCGADAHGTFQRDAFGMAAGKDYGFDMAVDLRIQVEAVASPDSKPGHAAAD